jgi:hypothetical protein
LLASIAFSGLTTTGAPWLRDSAVWAITGNSASLASFARLLFPLDGIADDVYSGVMERVFDRFAASEATNSLLDLAEAALNAQQQSEWFDLDEAAQIAAIKNIEGEAFFGTILNALRGAFYYDPAVWKHIDYPGSSKEYGGYINRGFNDIAWLPEGD